MFANLKVRTKLALGFGISILLMLAVSVVGITRMDKINLRVEEAASDRWPKTVLINDIIHRAGNIGIALRNMMLATSRNDLAKQKAAVLEERQAIGAAVQKLEQVVNLPRGREMLARLKELRQEYVAGQDKLIHLIETDHGEEAAIYLHGELRPILRKYQDQALAFARYQGELMEAAARESGAVYQEARTLMFVLVGAAVAMACLLSYLITRSLTRQLGGEPGYAAGIAQRVAAGDLSQEI
ncbi:MAG: methyl-accepting chemotaxis sensory transducer, partial [Rhodocyclaceae bacterium]|nr:methyl-accepting chemotaxis sensory transducer [Rhodocyclaceae bacterium]